MRSVEINGTTYTVPEVTFDTICTLEENGVYLLNMDQKNPKIATMLRGIVAWIMDTDTTTASREIQEHIQNGGDIGEILTCVTQAVTESGFFKQNPQSDTPQTGNREQRRKAQRGEKSTAR